MALEHRGRTMGDMLKIFGLVPADLPVFNQSMSVKQAQDTLEDFILSRIAPEPETDRTAPLINPHTGKTFSSRKKINA